MLTGVPHDATTSWIQSELQRRHLLSSRPDSRLTYELLLTPRTGAPRPLYDFQHLETAGLCNNATIHVTHYVRGGARGYTEGNLAYFQLIRSANSCSTVGGSNLRKTWFQCHGPASTVRFFQQPDIYCAYIYSAQLRTPCRSRVALHLGERTEHLEAFGEVVL